MWREQKAENHRLQLVKIAVLVGQKRSCLMCCLCREGGLYEPGTSSVFIIRSTTGEIWHKTFLRWVRSQDRSPHVPGIAKNTFGLVGISLIRDASGAMQYPPKGVKAWGDGPLKPEEISSAEAHSARFVPRRPNHWRGTRNVL